jgi:hypothetical protein
MRYGIVAATSVLLVSMQAQAVLTGADQPLPVKDGRAVVASVGNEAIFLDELVLQLEQPGDTTRLLQGRGTSADLELLNRLITVRLVVQEAATMGLADLPEIRKQVEVTARQVLREVLMARLVKDLKPDEAAIEKMFKDLVREWKTASLLFADEEQAKRVRDEIAAGADYGEVAGRAVADKRATPDGDDAYHRQKDYLPQIAEAITTLDVGQVSSVIRIPAGFVVVKVSDIRYPESAEARAQARKAVVRGQQEEALQAHEEALRAQYAVVHEDVLNGLNYEAAEPGTDALLKDTRVVAEIKGASPVTVGDLTDYLRMQSFHGGDNAAEGKRLNASKSAALDATLGRRVLNAEALRLGIDKTHAYADRVRAFEASLVFDTFVQKVIVPDNKMREDEIRTYYQAHLDQYSYPGMLRIRSLAFTKRGAAEAATEKLRAGTDYGWLAENAEGQADKDASGLLKFEGRLVTTDSMPEGVRKAVADTNAGDVRLYASPEGHFYVLVVQEIIPPNARPYDEVRDELAKKLYGQKLMKSIDDYAGKLRALSKVEIYLKKAE